MIRILFFILIFTTGAWAHAWTYTEYPELRSVDRAVPAPVPRLKSISLRPLRAPDAPTHRGWKVEQVYVSPGLEHRIFVKENVGLSSRKPLGSWLKLARGYVLHIPHRGKIVAYYTEGFTALERTEIQKSVIVAKSAHLMWSALIAPARAELAAPDGPESTVPAADCAGDISQSRACLLERARQNPRPATRAARSKNSASVAGPDYWSCAGQMLDGAWEATVGSVIGAAEYVWSWFKDPGEAWSETSKSFEESIDFVLNFRERIAESVEGFMELDPEIRDELICNLLGQIGTAGLMTAAISWTGVGAAAGTARVVEMVKSFIGKVKPAMRGLSALSKLKGSVDLRADNVRKYLRSLVRGEADPSKVRVIDAAAESHPSLVPRILDNMECLPGKNAVDRSISVKSANAGPSCGGIDDVLISALERSDGKSPRFERAMAEVIDLSDTPRPRYTVNDRRHGDNADGNPAASRLPPNAMELYRQSVPYRDGSGRINWWSVEKRGNRCVYHRFQGTNNEVHWNGSTESTHAGGLTTKMSDVPESIKSVLSTFAQCRN